jgi:rod shape-determining protein MreB
MLSRGSVAIDLGTVNTLVWVDGRGLVLEEPSAIAIDDRDGSVTAIGTAADALADKEPKGIRVIHPLRDGVIADLDATAEMLHGFLRKSGALNGPFRRRALVCVPGGATWVERRSVVAVFGTRRPRCVVELIDEPVAAAAGAGFDLSAGAGGLVVDIGGGTTEVAAVAGWRVVRAESLRMAGNAMDEAIVNAARASLGMILGQRAARQLKASLGLTGGLQGWAEAVGLDAARRTPRIEKVPADLVASALEPVVSAIGGTLQDVLSDIPAGLAEDVVRSQVSLSGGGALLPGLADRLAEVAGIGVVVAEDPLRCVVRGAAAMLLPPGWHSRRCPRRAGAGAFERVKAWRSLSACRGNARNRKTRQFRDVDYNVSRRAAYACRAGTRQHWTAQDIAPRERRPPGGRARSA